jgi:hypothetical protein
MLCAAAVAVALGSIVPSLSVPATPATTVELAGTTAHSRTLTLTSPRPQPSGYFGIATAVTESTVVIGAYNENVSGHPHAGRAYLYNASSGDLVHSLRSPVLQNGGAFGNAVAISGTTVAVGAEGQNASGFAGAGQVYLFNATSGRLIRTLSSPTPQNDGVFGDAVAISGSTVVVGADNENASGYDFAGHVYVFNASTGAVLQTLTSPNAREVGLFGFSVAVDGATALVGAIGENASGTVGAGHAYVFNGTTGALLSTLTSPNPQYLGHFGTAVAIHGGRAVVGAPLETVSGFDAAGRVYIFRTTTGSLALTLTSPSPQTQGFFGESVGFTGDRLVVGASTETADGLSGAGHAYVFRSDGVLLSTLTSPNAQSGGNFGTAVAIRSATVVVGADFETVSGNPEAGRAYVFHVA